MPHPKNQPVTFAELFQQSHPDREVVYKKAGDEALKYFLFYPPGFRAGEAIPAVVWFHGGGWTAGDANVFFPHARYFAQRGAIGVSVAYRLVKPDGPTVGDCVADAKSALRYLRSHAAELGIDPKHIAALGDSAGGHLAAALATVGGFDDPGDDLSVNAMPDLMVLFNPVLDLTYAGFIRTVMGGAAMDKHATPEQATPSDAQLALAKKLSPLNHVARIPPTLVMHGAQDRIVPAGQSEKFCTLARAAGNSCEFALLPNARHAFVVARYTAAEAAVVDVLRRTDVFLVTHGWIKGTANLEVSAEPAWKLR